MAWVSSLPNLVFSSVYAGRLSFKLSGLWVVNGSDWGSTGVAEVVVRMDCGPSGGPYIKSSLVNKLCGFAEVEIDYPGGGVLYVAQAVLVSNTPPASGAYMSLGLTELKIAAKLTKK